jgi:cell division septum initiation protein DivIVA
MDQTLMQILTYLLQVDQDRVTLQQEVVRLRAENEQLREKVAAAPNGKVAKTHDGA